MKDFIPFQMTFSAIVSLRITSNECVIVDKKHVFAASSAYQFDTSLPNLNSNKYSTLINIPCLSTHYSYLIKDIGIIWIQKRPKNKKFEVQDEVVVH